MNQIKTEITTAVKAFMGGRRVCYARPGTDRHTANFYGDHHVERFSQSQLATFIESFYWDYSDECYWPELSRDATVAECIRVVLTDMQFEKPTL